MSVKPTRYDRGYQDGYDQAAADADAVRRQSRRLIYLACPYSGTPEQITARVEHFAKTAARIERSGLAHAVSPVMNHLLLGYAELPGDWAFWKSYSLALLPRCDELWVLRLPGWEESTGVRGEIEFASRQGMPVHYLDDMGPLPGEDARGR